MNIHILVLIIAIALFGVLAFKRISRAEYWLRLLPFLLFCVPVCQFLKA